MVNDLQVRQLEDELRRIGQALELRGERPPPVIKVNTKWKKFQRTYRNDPLAFCFDCFDDDGPNEYQEQPIAELQDKKRIGIVSPRGGGKSYTLSRLVLWSFMTADESKTVTTASVWRQLSKYLWPEIHKAITKMKWDKIGRDPFRPRLELKNTEIYLSESQFAFAASPSDSEKLEGLHAKDRVTAVIDEGKAVPDSTFDSLEGSLSDPDEPLMIMASIPGGMIGRFYEICTNRDNKYPDWTIYRWTQDQLLKAGRMRRDWVEDRRVQWGEDSALYKNHVLGEFANDASNALIKIAWIEKAIERWHENHDYPVNAIGADIARGGEDKTFLALAHDKTVMELIGYDEDDTMKIAELIKRNIGYNKKIPIYTDVIGVGAGVYDKLKLDGFQAYPFNAGEKPPDDATDNSKLMKFKDRRSWMWWKAREMFDINSGIPVAIPDDDALKGELNAPGYDEQMGVIKVESKKDIRTRLNRSTDRADATLQVLTGDEVCDLDQTDVWTMQEWMDANGY